MNLLLRLLQGRLQTLRLNILYGQKVVVVRSGMLYGTWFYIACPKSILIVQLPVN